jgi:hypothetical protein
MSRMLKASSPATTIHADVVRILSALVCSCLLLCALVCSCLLVSALVCSCLLLSAPVCSCLLLSALIFAFSHFLRSLSSAYMRKCTTTPTCLHMNKCSPALILKVLVGGGYTATNFVTQLVSRGDPVSVIYAVWVQQVTTGVLLAI